MSADEDVILRGNEVFEIQVRGLDQLPVSMFSYWLLTTILESPAATRALAE